VLTARRNAIAAAVLLLAASASFGAWWDTMPHKWTPPPLVNEIEAEALQGVSGGGIVKDVAARGGKALAVRPGGRLTWSFEGKHSHYRLIGIVRIEGAPAEAPKEDVPSIFCRLEVTDPTGKTDFWRMRIGARGAYTNCLDFYFPAYHDGKYIMRLTVEKDSAEPLIMDWLEVRDLFGDCIRKPIKTGRRLISDEQVMQMRAAAAAAPQPRRRRGVNPLELPVAERQAVFDRIWASPPPRNACLSIRNSPAKWDLPLTALDQPWGFTDAGHRRMTYGIEDYRAGRRTSSPRPDDGWGYIGKDGRNASWIGVANHSRWGQLLKQVKTRTETWLKTGDAEAGWRATAFLAAVADRWCDLDHAVQGHKIYNASGRFAHTFRPGKLGHNFWDLGN